jgi:hypothetical protein
MLLPANLSMTARLPEAHQTKAFPLAKVTLRRMKYKCLTRKISKEKIALSKTGSNTLRYYDDSYDSDLPFSFESMASDLTRP